MLRTAIRRYAASCELLPKSLRKSKEQRRSLSDLERLFKLNNRVRDLDIVLSQLSARLPYPDLGRVVDGIARERATLLAQALEFAKSLSPKFDAVRASTISAGRLRRRFRKVNEGELRDAEDDLEAVRKDAKNIKALHSLRIHCKEIRYTLELEPKSEVRDILSRFEEWQDALGAIRDLDVVVGYLGGLDLSPAERVFVEEKRSERARLYSRFLDSTKRTGLLNHLREVALV